MAYSRRPQCSFCRLLDKLLLQVLVQYSLITPNVTNTHRFVIIPGCLHPQEVNALLYGIVYYITIPSMYMLLVIYSVFNMNDVSWGTRENADPNAAAGAAAPKVQVYFMS